MGRRKYAAEFKREAVRLAGVSRANVAQELGLNVTSYPTGLAARDYLARIESLCGVPVDMISSGPERDETIVRRHPFDAS